MPQHDISDAHNDAAVSKLGRTHQPWFLSVARAGTPALITHVPQDQKPEATQYCRLLLMKGSLFTPSSKGQNATRLPSFRTAAAATFVFLVTLTWLVWLSGHRLPARSGQGMHCSLISTFSGLYARKVCRQRSGKAWTVLASSSI